MNFEQPKPDSKKYSDLIADIEKGIIKIPSANLCLRSRNKSKD